MRVTQGTFSFLPDLTDRQIVAQLEYCLQQNWAVSIEFTDDPHPRNTYWDMWGPPMFDLRDAAGAMSEIKACREANPNTYVRVSAFDSTRGWETVRLSFFVQRPAEEPGFRLERVEAAGRMIRYAVRAYSLDRPAGQRYPSVEPATEPRGRRS
ncbi:MAG: ribulose bisphosphate carboxylase small subunit [Proteobacteria bacterium]|nr:ribulose bisphosphate carboxylase small subunit [Pseudomonadota bacterium]